MNTSPRDPHYDLASRILHWLTAVAVTIGFILGPSGFGKLMKEGVDPATRIDIVWHETLGVTVFVMTLARLLWLIVRPAAPKFEMAGWMYAASKAVHAALWLLLLALPVTALLALGSEQHPLTLLGGFRIDHLPWIADSSIAELTDWGDLHGLLGDILMWLAGLHAAAAIFHYWVLRDGVLYAMLPLPWMRRR